MSPTLGCRPAFVRCKPAFAALHPEPRSFEAVEVDLSEGKLPPLPDVDYVVHVRADWD